MIDLYLSNVSFKGYVDRYCRKHHVTIEEALQHEIVKYVAEYYIKGCE